MAQLDEIEKTMAQLSPRILQTDLADDQQKYMPISPNNSMTLSPFKLNADYYPPSPSLPQQPEVPSLPVSNPQAAWPATPFASIRAVSPPPRHDSLAVSPPRLAVNGITTSAPKSFAPNPFGEMSAESQLRKRELEEEQGFRRPSKPQEASESPIIPLSPDPFGRFSSTPADSSGSRQTSTYWDQDTVPEISAEIHTSAPIVSPDIRKRSNSTATTSRFSADSIVGVEANSNNVAKPNRATLMTVNTFKKLWRKSTKNTSSSNPPTTPSNTSFSPIPPVPIRPERPPQEQSDDPPKAPIFGRFSPQPAPPRRSQDVPPPVPRAPSQPSVPVLPQQLRPIPQLPPQSQSQNVPTLSPPAPHQQSPIPHPQELGAVPQQRPPTPHTQHHHQYSIPPPQQQVPIPQQLVVPPPPFNGRSANPIVATQMRPSRSNSTLDRLQFDQESPYPITRRPQANSRQSSPPPLPSPTPQTVHLPPPTPTVSNPGSPKSTPSSSPPQEKANARKSILKGWKSSSISSTASIQQAIVPESRPSFERLNVGAARTKRTGALNFESSRTSISSLPPDIPPSPQIPQQFASRSDNRQSIKSRLTNSSIDSSHSPPQSNGLGPESTPRRSMASSRSSEESRPSFDTSQFEMVSPKMDRH
ncbi:hypothetical protein H0H87_006438 [Tephrocybe sp. NHM501043]|nr:hypothetical protein H0H87_006438 [Tephrocybe sp. NHM501043]